MGKTLHFQIASKDASQWQDVHIHRCGYCAEMCRVIALINFETRVFAGKETVEYAERSPRLRISAESLEIGVDCFYGLDGEWRQKKQTVSDKKNRSIFTISLLSLTFHDGTFFLKRHWVF